MKALQPSDKDAPVTIELGMSWLGVNERDDPAALATDAGEFVRVAINARFRARRAESRPGYIAPLALNGRTDGAGNLGAGLYVDALGREWVAVVQTYTPPDLDATAALMVMFGRVGQGPQPTYMALSSVHSTAGGRFMQAGTDLILWRSGGDPLLWDGAWSSRWTLLSEAPANGYAPYLQPLPAATFGIYKADRVIFPYGTGVGYTDILAPRRWDPDLQQFPVEGPGPVTGLAYLRQSLIVFKETRVVSYNNFTGDLSEVSREEISSQTGCVAHATIAEAGGDLMWLGRGGVYRLSETVSPSGEGSLTVKKSLTPVPVSWPIPRTMDRINWAAAAGACAVLADGLYYLSVPVDGSLANNAIFVYDTVMGTWQGEDQLRAHSYPYIQWMVRTTVYGVESPVLVGLSGVYAGGHGWHDGYGSGDIYFSVRFRGYPLEEAGLKTLQALEIQTEELGSNVSLYTNTDGRRLEQTVQTAQLRDRTKWVFFNATDRNLTNANNDAAGDNREDYAWVAGDSAMCKAGGIPLGYLQRHKLGGKVRGAAMWMSPAIASSRGRVRVCAVRASGTKRRDWARRQ